MWNPLNFVLSLCSLLNRQPVTTPSVSHRRSSRHQIIPVMATLTISSVRGVLWCKRQLLQLSRL